MPELPEVETTCRGITPHLLRQTIKTVIVRQRQLRWPVTRGFKQTISGQKITSICRRGKYLLINVEALHGSVLIHLGMSGSLRLVNLSTPVQKHDHVDIVLNNGQVLRYTDPRRFGTIQWIKGDPLQHALLAHLGPEPVKNSGIKCDKVFDADYLYLLSRKRKVAIKSFLMDSKVVVGVGNIYANEALFLSGIRPTLAAGKVSQARYAVLVENVKKTLEKAIEAGGTTLQDFVSADGKPGYFSQALKVYGRGGQPCYRCKTLLKEIRLGQRSTVFCPKCQK